MLQVLYFLQKVSPLYQHGGIITIWFFKSHCTCGNLHALESLNSTSGEEVRTSRLSTRQEGGCSGDPESPLESWKATGEGIMKQNTKAWTLYEVSPIAYETPNYKLNNKGIHGHGATKSKMWCPITGRKRKTYDFFTYFLPYKHPCLELIKLYSLSITALWI